MNRSNDLNRSIDFDRPLRILGEVMVQAAHGDPVRCTAIGFGDTASILVAHDGELDPGEVLNLLRGRSVRYHTDGSMPRAESMDRCHARLDTFKLKEV